MLSGSERLGFSVRKFMEQYQLDASAGGAHMWREIWDPKVTDIYKDILSKRDRRSLELSFFATNRGFQSWKNLDLGGCQK
jgi:hypothetical protein